jgi:hypothetical protein
MRNTSRFFGLLLTLATPYSVLAGCSSGTADGTAPAGQTTANESGDRVAPAPDSAEDTSAAADALAKDSVPGIRGCSGTYTCDPYSSTAKPFEVELRTLDGECWAGGKHLKPDGTVVGDTKGFWIEQDGGFVVRSESGTGVAACVTTTGSSKSGPKRTEAHCQLEPEPACARMNEGACKGEPRCSWYDYGGPQYARCVGVGAPACYQQPDVGGCQKLVGCSWK